MVRKHAMIVRKEVKYMGANQKGMNARSLVQCALFAALMCILSPIAIPVGPVPVTLGIFVVLLTAMVLPWRRAAGAVGVYLLIGLIGLPVFSGGGAGFGVLAGPTGGYLWCYLPIVMLAASLKQWCRGLPGCLLALLLCYFTGTWQFTALMDCGWKYALSVCVYPFLVFDLIKILLAAILGGRIRRRLETAELI